jgi:tetratricopeptide (TPR) repeat protein
LVDAASGLVTWSNVLTRPEAEAYSIPKIVAGELLASLGGAEAEQVSLDPALDPQAYELLLRARALTRQDPGRNLSRIIEILDRAVEREPDLAEGWALLALARLNFAMSRPGHNTMGYRNRDPEQRLSASRAEARRALALDPDSPEARLALVVVDYRARLLPLGEAEQKFRAVLDHAPNHPNANMRMGMMLVELGRYDEALHYFRRAHQLDPLSLQPSGFFLQYALQTGHVEEAEAVLARGDHPWFTYSYQRLEWLLSDHDLAAARQWLAEARRQGHYWSHGVTSMPQQEPQDPERLHSLIARLLDVAANGDPGSDAGLPADFVSAADDGLLLHFYAATLLGTVGYVDEVFDLVLQRLAVDDIWMRGGLFRRSFESIRANPAVMAWFEAGTQRDYWLETGRGPDFCREPSLPYDCAEAAGAFKRGTSAPGETGR